MNKRKYLLIALAGVLCPLFILYVVFPANAVFRIRSMAPTAFQSIDTLFVKGNYRRAVDLFSEVDRIESGISSESLKEAIEDFSTTRGKIKEFEMNSGSLIFALSPSWPFLKRTGVFIGHSTTDKRLAVDIIVVIIPQDGPQQWIISRIIIADSIHEYIKFNSKASVTTKYYNFIEYPISLQNSWREQSLKEAKGL